MDASHGLMTLGALAVVLGLVWAAARGARAAGLARAGGRPPASGLTWAAGLARPAPGRRLLLREAVALDRTRRLHLVACDGRDLLLLTGGGADVVVGWLPAPDAGA